ncbi:uncharacterized protein LOC124909587 [Impatiens glandulifera]|uniref:uncharacterized protein LOC124909587 n=1 Tax=Impatiens glandulifera TaxID=253017 RepID=UPI001FB0FC52|nr:uncharacterized protein LOC124909587 [Impatiens glandulifera]
MIKSLEETGLQCFLDDKHTIYPESILEFFYHAKVFRGTPHFETHIQSKVGGIVFDFTERDFARCLSLPRHGITDLDIPADVKAEVSIAFSRSDEPVEDHGAKSRLRAEYQLLNDVLGGQKKKTAKKAASAKAKAEGKGKEKITFSEPPQHTEDEEWASERTDTEKTEDDRTVLNEDGSVQSPKDAAPNTNPETTEARLEKAKGELIQEVERLEAICSRMQVPVYHAPKIERFPANCPTPPQENAAPIESSERADQNLTEQSPPPPPEVTASDFTKEWVEDRIKEFDETAVQPFKDRSGRIVDSALKFTDVTRNLLERHQERFSELGKGLWDVAVQQDKCVQRTTILEDVTSELKKDLDRLERDTDQRLNAMSEDLIGTTLNWVSELEKINGRFAEKVANQAVEDAVRLEREARRLEGYAKENKKKKAAASDSAPKKRKREAPKKVKIVELLDEVTDTVVTGTSQQADQVEEEVEEQLRSRSTKRRTSEPTGRQQPKKKSIYDFTDSE